jgi:serine/threonine protein kinase
MGREIYLCTEQTTGRLLVWKFWDKASKPCFEREVLALSNLETEPFLPRLSIGLKTTDGWAMARTYIAGQSLGEALSELSVQEKALLFARLKKTLTRLHDLGWVHRDMTPNNVILERDQQPILVDWDLAERLQGQNEKSYTPRGTLGFSHSQPKLSLIQQDIEALDRIGKFLSIEGQTTIKVETKKSWWQELF